MGHQRFIEPLQQVEKLEEFVNVAISPVNRVDNNSSHLRPLQLLQQLLPAGSPFFMPAAFVTLDILEPLNSVVTSVHLQPQLAGMGLPLWANQISLMTDH
jgi:hypothetical protein